MLRIILEKTERRNTKTHGHRKSYFSNDNHRNLQLNVVIGQILARILIYATLNKFVLNMTYRLHIMMKFMKAHISICALQQTDIAVWMCTFRCKRPSISSGDLKSNIQYDSNIIFIKGVIFMPVCFCSEKLSIFLKLY